MALFGTSYISSLASTLFKSGERCWLVKSRWLSWVTLKSRFHRSIFCQHRSFSSQAAGASSLRLRGRAANNPDKVARSVPFRSVPFSSVKIKSIVVHSCVCWLQLRSALLLDSSNLYPLRTAGRHVIVRCTPSTHTLATSEHVAVAAVLTDREGGGAREKWQHSLQ